MINSDSVLDKGNDDQRQCKVKDDLRQYSVAKEAAKDFQDAKNVLFKAFAKADLGNWVKKPMEQDEFHLWRKQIKSKFQKVKFFTFC